MLLKFAKFSDFAELNWMHKYPRSKALKLYPASQGIRSNDSADVFCSVVIPMIVDKCLLQQNYYKYTL